MTKRYDAVFFDMGYTLAWFHPSAGELIAQAWNDAGLPVTPAEVEKAFKAIWQEENESATANGFPSTREYDEQAEYARSRRMMQLLGGGNEEMLRTYLARANELFSRPGAIQLYDDVLPVLDALRAKGYRLGIVSNWSWNLTDRCKQVGIEEYFDVIMASAYAGFNKPHPGIFQRTLDEMRLPANRVVHVGDLYDADVVGARAAGLAGVLLDRRNQSGDFDCPVVHDLLEFLSWLSKT